MRPLLFLLFSATLQAQQSIVVTGTYEPLPLEESERLVILLPVRSATRLMNTFVDALRLDPALDLRQRAPNGIQGDVSIRGASFGQTLVLVDGQRQSDAQSGHHNLDVATPLDSIEQIEILHGAGSTLYGSDAVGGVINLITKPPESTEIRLRTGLGNFGVNQQRAALAGVWGRFSEQLTFSRDFSSGFMPDRDYRNLSFGSTTRWAGTRLNLGYADKPFGALGFYGNYPSWERTKTWFAGIRQAVGERTELGFSYRRHTDLFVLYRDQPERYTNRHATESWQANVRRREPVARNVTVFYGAEGLGDTITSNNLGNHSRARAALYGSVDVRVLSRWSLTAGVREEVFRGLPGEWSPSFGAGYWLSSKVKLRASVSRAFRLPTYTDLYYRDPANRGNPLLQPEQAWSYEGGLDYRPSAAWRIQGTLFHRRDTNGIDYVRAPGSPIWDAVNVQSLRFTGVEGAASRKLRGGVLDWTYTGIRGTAQTLAGLQSKYAFNYLTNSGLFGWTGHLGQRIMVRTRIGAAERKNYKAYPVWDLYGSGRVGSVHPYVQFTNLTNSHIEDIPGVVNPGRAVVGGIEWVWRQR